MFSKAEVKEINAKHNAAGILKKKLFFIER